MEINKLTELQITDAIENVQKMLPPHEVLYVSSSDQFLSEYVPLADCLRYYLSGFTGSTAELLLSSNHVWLFVDGRYHEQAELEKHPLVTVEKVPYGTSLAKALLGKITQLAPKLVWLIAQRTSYAMFEMCNDLELGIFDQDRLLAAIGYQFQPELKTPYLLNTQQCGESSAEKLQHIFPDGEGSYFIGAADQVSWITNLRGFHAPFQSFIMAKALITAEHIYLFNDGSYDLDPIAEQDGLVSLHHFNQLREVLTQCKPAYIYFDRNSTTLCDYGALEVIEVPLYDGRITAFQCIKNRSELKVMREAFDRSNQAIVQSLRWVQEFSTQKKISELDFYQQVNEFYKKQGAIDQSFNTIAAVDENSSIIHFGAASADKIIGDNSIILLDTGAHYVEGYATDTTRTICVGSQPQQEFIRYYTLVLKGLLQAEMAVFPVGTWGAQIDALARNSLRQQGLDYMHGTGHGVGINVHEPGFSISAKSQVPLLANMVGSIEPGFYKSGLGGIRLENIVQVVEHEQFAGMLKFVPLTWIGYDYNLIDLELLTVAEKSYLQKYERECYKRGTSFNFDEKLWK